MITDSRAYGEAIADVLDVLSDPFDVIPAETFGNPGVLLRLVDRLGQQDLQNANPRRIVETVEELDCVYRIAWQNLRRPADDADPAQVACARYHVRTVLSLFARFVHVVEEVTG